MDSLGIYHATIAQLFFVLTCAIALFTSRFWLNLPTGRAGSPQPADGAMGTSRPTEKSLRTLVLATTLLIFGQLIIAAAMRHQHAGLAISDFPLAHGKLWPATSAEAVARYNAQRVSINAENPITAFQIELQMAHRIVALAILILTAVVAWRAWQWPGGKDPLTKLALAWFALILLQVGLGAATIWTNKAADVATAHVLVGALALAVGALWCAIAFRESAAAFYDRQTEDRRSPGSAAMAVQPAMTGNK